MAGGILRALYSGTRGLDLGPTKLRLDERYRNQQLAEDMRRALAGEKIQESELALRQSALAQQKESDQQRMALEQALQTQRIQAQQQEGAAQRAFQGQEGGYDRAAREKALQMQQAFGAGEAEKERAFQMAQRDADRKQNADQFTTRMAMEDSQFAKKLALEEDEGKKRMMFQQRSQELQERGLALQQQEIDLRRQGMGDPETQRKLEALKLEYQKLQNLAAKYGIERGAIEDQAAMAGIESTRARTEGQNIENEAMRAALAGKKAGPAAPAAPQQTKFKNLDKGEQGDAKRLDRLLGEGKATDVQKAMSKAYAMLNELAGDDDDDAKERSKKLRDFITEAKKNEDYNFSLPWWTGGIGLALNTLPTDSDLEDMAEELGLHTKGQ